MVLAAAVAAAAALESQHQVVPPWVHLVGIYHFAWLHSLTSMVSPFLLFPLGQWVLPFHSCPSFDLGYHWAPQRPGYSHVFHVVWFEAIWLASQVLLLSVPHQLLLPPPPLFLMPHLYLLSSL